jgi:hypothetical protein
MGSSPSPGSEATSPPDLVDSWEEYGRRVRGDVGKGKEEDECVVSGSGRA